MSETAERKAYRAKWYQQNKARLAQKDRVKYKLETGKSLTQEEQELLLPKTYERSNLVDHKPKQTREERLEYYSRPEVKERRNELARKRYVENNELDRELLNERARTYRQENAEYCNAKERDRNKSPERIAYKKAYYLKKKLEKKGFPLDK